MGIGPLLLRVIWSFRYKSEPLDLRKLAWPKRSPRLPRRGRGFFVPPFNSFFTSCATKSVEARLLLILV